MTFRQIVTRAIRYGSPDNRFVERGPWLIGEWTVTGYFFVRLSPDQRDGIAYKPDPNNTKAAALLAATLAVESPRGGHPAVIASEATPFSETDPRRGHRIIDPKGKAWTKDARSYYIEASIFALFDALAVDRIRTRDWRGQPVLVGYRDGATLIVASPIRAPQRSDPRDIATYRTREEHMASDTPACPKDGATVQASVEFYYEIGPGGTLEPTGGGFLTVYCKNDHDLYEDAIDGIGPRSVDIGGRRDAFLKAVGTWTFTKKANGESKGKREARKAAEAVHGKRKPTHNATTGKPLANRKPKPMPKKQSARKPASRKPAELGVAPKPETATPAATGGK